MGNRAGGFAGPLSLPAGSAGGIHHRPSLARELTQSMDERRQLNLPRQLTRLNLLIVDGPGFVPLSRTGAELPLDFFRRRCGRGSNLMTANLPFDEWTDFHRTANVYPTLASVKETGRQLAARPNSLQSRSPPI